MNQTLLKSKSTHRAVPSLARLAEPHGYRLDGDTVHLQARLTALNFAAQERAWALQLWACPTRPVAAGDLAGQVVAEVELPPMSEAADETEPLDMSTFATPPAGSAQRVMVLVLAAGSPGHFNEVHDFAVYARPQQFLQPRLRGAVGYRIEGDRVHLSVEHIENPRDVGNQSGTLALELWALSAPYAGGAFEGVPLAGVAIGTLGGQTEANITNFQLPFSRPPAGQWHFVLMLREWTAAAGYLTRDYTNFSAPVTYNTLLSASLSAAEPQGTALKATTPPVKILTETRPQAVTEAKPMPPLVSSAPTKSTVAKVESKPIPATSTSPKTVSVNTAAEAELAALDGLNPKLARAILKNRPYGSIEDLRGIRGISAKVLAAIRSRLRL